MVNKVILVGRLGRDPEVKHLSGGKSVANFSIATDETYKDRNGERQKKTEWHNIVAWGATAESVEKYLRKGSLVYVEGALNTRKWEKDGQTRSTTEVNASNIRFLDKAEKGEEREAAPSRPEITDEDIPF